MSPQIIEASRKKMERPDILLTADSEGPGADYIDGPDDDYRFMEEIRDFGL